MATRNLTLRLPADLYESIKFLAARRDTSISALVADKIGELIEEETGYARARSRALELLADGFDLGTRGRVAWSRDSLHDR